MSKLTNNEKIKRIKQRKILKAFILIFGLSTIILAILSLTINLNPIFAIISFIIEFILSKYREKLDPKEVNPDSKNQE